MRDRIIGSLLLKELRQILRNKQILAMLIVTPTLQMIVYGLALNPDVQGLMLGVVDMSQTPKSRELTASLLNNNAFQLGQSFGRVHSLYERVDGGELDAGVVIPPEFARDLAANRPAELQVVLSAVDANTAGIAASYITQIIGAYEETLQAKPQRVQVDISFLYNPGLNATWFFVPAVIAMSLTVAGTLVATSSLLREKEQGTVDQLLMSPASPTQILIAKIAPLLVVLFGVVNMSLMLALVIFHVPMRGSYLLFCIASFEYMFVLIALGLSLATYAQNQRQALLTTFFVMMPLIQLSGALSPLETMPPFFQKLSVLNPLRFYIVCVRGILLKGNGLTELMPSLTVLFVFALVFMTISASRFRKQLA